MYVYDYSNTPVEGLNEAYKSGYSFPCDGDSGRVLPEEEE